MSVIWNKVWSDLWHHKLRTFLAVLSIAAGVFALGAIFGMIDQLIPNLNRVHQSINAAHLTMNLADRIDEDTATRLKHIDGVKDVEPINEISVRYRLTADEDWQPAQLVMRDDYEHQKFSLLQLKAGEWPHRDNIGVDIRAAQYLGLEFGDKVIFDLDGTDRALPVSGRIRHHFMTSPDFGDNPRFFVDAQALERFGIPKGEFNQLLVQVEPYSDQLARDIATEIKDHLGKEGVSVAVTFYNKPDEHWGSDFFVGLNLVLQLLAVVSLFMSVVLVYNTLSALITEQKSQIGVMKAIGGRTGTIVKVYLMAVLVYGALALFISLPLGAYVAFSAAGYFLGIFNIDHSTFEFSTRAIIIQAAAAIAVPLLAALIPVFNGAMVTVRAAIASYGLGGNFGASRLDRGIERLSRRFLSAPNAIALANMFRRKGRLSLTQLVLITAGTLFLMVMTLSNSIQLTVDNELARRDYQTRLQFEDNQRIDRIVRMTESLPEVSQAELRFQQPASILRAGQATKEAGTGGMLIGVPDGSDLILPRIVAGRWLQAGDDRAVVMNEETAEDNDIALGEQVTLDLGELGDSKWQVVGFYRVLSVVPESDAVYAPQAAIFRATTKHNVGQMLLVRTRPATPATAAAVTTHLKDLFEHRNWEVADTQTIYEDRSFFDNFFAQYLGMLFGLAFIMAIVGGIGLTGSLSISVVERTKEIGVMRAIGAKTPVLMLMFILEGVLQGLVSWLVAVPVSFVVGRPLANVVGQAMFSVNLDYQYDLQAVLMWLGLVVVIAILASIMPARSAVSISVRESLAYA
ncbi:MAG: ABC transporter permease [Anaerolineales bacterium]|nr:ABC transporter permease [Anaerolineales bacterium]